MQTEGYMIVLRPEALVDLYAESYVAKQNPGPLLELRQAFQVFNPGKYRGISRKPLDPYPSLDQEMIDTFEATGGDMRSNAKARRKFCELRGNLRDLPDDFEGDSDLLSSAKDASEVMSLLDEPTEWEIIHVCRGRSDRVPGTLGFDIGYWGGDHFSIIADVVVIPIWHPPAPEDFPALKESLMRLNKHLLFDSVQDAEEYKRYYKSRPWAETESEEGEFCIIRVDAEKFNYKTIHRLQRTLRVVGRPLQPGNSVDFYLDKIERTFYNLVKVFLP